jgi:hypothetical protein
LAVTAGFAVAAAPASGDIRINEIESQAIGGGPDWVEVTNTGAAAVDIGGYQLRDSGNGAGNQTNIPAGTILQPGGFFAIDSNAGLGNPDQVRLFDNGLTLIDSYSFADHALTTFGRCPDGTGPFETTVTDTRGAANVCWGPPVPGDPWPGGTGATLLDDAATFGMNVSGLAYQPSGTAAPGVLWAVRNSNESSLFRLVLGGGLWSPVTPGFTKKLVYKNGLGEPDAEGVTLADGDPNGIYVATERDGGGGSLPKVLRYDTSAGGAVISATHEWNLAAGLPPLGDNAGLEAIAFVPDTLLVAKGLVDDSKGGAKYAPANYPNHGQGLFFVGVEQTGDVIGFALNSATETFTRITTVKSSFRSVMELEYEPETTHLWALCDDNCDGRSVTLDIAPNGKFAVTKTYARPAGMDNFNNEGFAIAPQAECVGGVKPTFYAEDSDANSHALRGGTINCTPLPPVDEPEPTPSPQPAAPTPTPTAIPTPPADRTGPSLKLALKFSKTGTYAVRKSGKFGLVLTLGERADLTISATARKNAKAKARTILKATTRKGVAAGKPTLKLSLSSKVRKALRKGETLTLTVVARDAAGNATTTKISAKVP